MIFPRAVRQLADAKEIARSIDRTGGTGLPSLVPNKCGALRAAEAAVDEKVVFVSGSESHNRKIVNRAIKEWLASFEDVARVADDAAIRVHGKISVAFGWPFEGGVEASVSHELPEQIMKATLRLYLHPLDSVRVAEG